MMTRSMSNCVPDEARRFLGVPGWLPEGVPGNWGRPAPLKAEFDDVRFRPAIGNGVPARLDGRLDAGVPPDDGRGRRGCGL